MIVLSEGCRRTYIESYGWSGPLKLLKLLTWERKPTAGTIRFPCFFFRKQTWIVTGIWKFGPLAVVDLKQKLN